MRKYLFLFLLFCAAILTAETPKLKIAVTSDIHGQWKVLEKVYAFLAAKNPDAVIFCGDLAPSVADVPSYKAYIGIYNKHFAKCDPKPVHVPIPGNHDFWAPKGQKRLPPQDSLKRFYGTMGMTPQWLRHHVVKGYTIIGVAATDEKGTNSHTPQEIKEVSDLIGKAEKAAPGKPVFVATHCPPAFTMSSSAFKKKSPGNRGWYWRYDIVRQMLDGHPQAVSLSGHTHLALQDERAIWQGEFTAVSVGVLPRVIPKIPGKKSGSMRSALGAQGRNFTYIEVFDKYMLIYRYDANTLKEISPDKRWRVELPYDPAKAVYTDKRAEKTVAPEFPANAKAEIVRKQKFYIRLDRAAHPDMVHSYKVKLEYDNKKYKTQEFFVPSDFFVTKKAKRPMLPFPPTLQVYPGATGTMTIQPFEPFGKGGKVLVTKFTIPEKK